VCYTRAGATGHWAFVSAGSAIDSLAANEALDLVYTVWVSDEWGATSTTQDIVFHFVGVNDTASFGGDLSGIVTEDGTLIFAGTANVQDRDHDQSGFDEAWDSTSTYGNFTFDPSTGEWSYELRNGDANVQALSSSQTVHDYLYVKSIDGSMQTITMDIAGADESAGRTFIVNHGQSVINGHIEQLGFTSADKLKGAGYDYKNFALVDYQGDSVMDTAVTFSFHGNASKPDLTVYLIGFTSFDPVANIA
jgi:VCBS repeat-containing protein